MYIVGDDVLGVPRPWIKTDKTGGDRHIWHFNSAPCNKKAPLVAPAVEQVPQLYSPTASSIASQWYSAIAE